EPENMAEATTMPVEDYTGKTVAEATEELTELGVEVVVAGDQSEVVAQYPENEETVLKGGKVILKTAGKTALPDFTGWSKRELLAYQSLSGLALEMAGQGYVLTQSIAEGQIVEDNEPVVIELHPPEIYYPAQAEEDAAEDDGEQPFEEEAAKGFEAESEQQEPETDAETAETEAQAPETATETTEETATEEEAEVTETEETTTQEAEATETEETTE